MADRFELADSAEAPANQVSVPRWAALKHAYVSRLSKSERAALAVTAELAQNPVNPPNGDPFADPFADPADS
ncbi:hypothetical protein E3T23_05375 [Cryobacterium cheniae]|uniref:Uncharacterized protein n=1 Tax=Cryobacterium cheniae TaxID=1259262 RepID=A0A4R8XS96_9MICO|nr:hypothetical protein [Cryobacterium cheniae]TFC81975.1 hypothetical protein E3T23_05375 [Cryobacterium cheniae]